VEVETQRRRLASFAWVAIFGWVSFAAPYAVLGRWRAVTLDLVVIAGTLVVLRLCTREGASSRRVTVGATLTTAASCLGVALTALLSGGPVSISIWYLAVVPLFVAYLLGERATIIWSVIAFVAMVIVHFGDLWLAMTPEFVPEGDELLFGRGMLIFVVMAFAVAARRVTDSYVAAVQANAAMIQGQANALQNQTDALRTQADELVHARDLALAASQAKSAFVANTSHEIRTPLHGILGSAELALEVATDDESRSLISTILGSGRALLALLNDVLDLSKIEAGRMTIKVAPLDLRALVTEIGALFHANARSKGLQLVCVIAPQCPPFVTSDEVRLRQILANLVGNAVKFTERGQVELHVELLETVAEVARVRFVVEDTGIGIPPELQAEIFREFTQVEATSTRRFGGTGLGLAVCQRLVDLLGGVITVESNPGHGSRFVVELPLQISGPPEVATPAAVVAVTAISPMRVLVVDDNAANRELAARMLARLGLRADLAADGAEAVARVKDGIYDLILMDMQMPDVDGPGVTIAIRRLRADGPRPQIVAMTANVLQEDRIRCLAAGMDDFITKPISNVALRRAVQAAQERQSTATIP